MATPVPADLEDALAANPAARANFGAMSPEQKDAWVAWIDRARLPRARRRRVAEAVRRIGGGGAVRETEVAGPAVVPLPRDDWWVWLVGLALLAGLGAFLVWLTVYRDRDSHPATAGSVVVPKVVGSPAESARFQLKGAKLGSVLVHAAAAQPKGVVIRQSPRAGGTVPRGTTVTLVVSNGPAKPATVTAKTTTVATTVATTTVATTTIATTTARSTTPAPPSSGNGYTGMQLQPAIRKLTQGQQQAIVSYATSSRPAGVVVASSNAGTRMRLQVSSGASPQPMSSIPDVTGEDAATAVQDLQTAGFTAIQAKWPVSDASQVGQVVYETPAGGSQAPGGSAIVVYVGAS
jgi:beta-lactam-binding protein with PASTA domain